MKFTLSWLKRHLQTNSTASEIESILSLIGLEVEECVDKGLIYKDFIVAKIEEAHKHQDSDRLNICRVNNGKEILQIVCGGANARTGINVVLAPVGSKIPANGMEIKAAKIRGVESNGMLCSADELVIEGDKEGIIELPTDAPIGANFAEYANLNDILFDISITPNRGDAASITGIARDLAAAGLGSAITFKKPDLKTAGEAKRKVIIEDKTNCSEFSLRLIEGVNNKQSCSYPSAFMRSIGSSVKSALVDISNFAMMEFGRPNHIYDADKVLGDVVVRKSKAGEKFTPISGEEIELPADILVVADNSGVIAIAGVMGGETTKVTENTKNILVEVANFSAASVSKSGRALSLLSDSRFRFERRVDFGNSDFFNSYLAELILQECGGKAYELSSDFGEPVKQIEKIEFDFAYIKKLSGVEISESVAKEILNKLGFKVEGGYVLVPSYRQGDVIDKADIVEEVIRIYGFHNIVSESIPVGQKELFYKSPEFVEQAKLKCASRGYNEVISWAFVSHKMSQMFSFNDPFEVVNPISSEMVVMRQSTIPSLLEAYIANEARGVEDLSVFEVACLFDKKAQHDLNRSISGVRVGALNRKTHFKDERNFDFYDVKADLFALVDLYGLDPEKLQIKQEAPAYYHPGKSCSFFLGKMLLGMCGELHPSVLKDLDISKPVCAFELFVDRLPAIRSKNAKAKLVLSNYQKVDRDFAFLINKDVIASDVVTLIKNVEKNLIENVDIFDIYQGKNIEEGKKSIALTVKLSPSDRTLSDNEINEVSKKIIDEVTLRLGATLR